MDNIKATDCKAMQSDESFGLRKRLEKIYLHERGFGSGRKFIEKLVDAVGENGVFLDIGCGEGALRRVLSPGATYIGLDRYAGEKSGEYEGWSMRPNVVGDAHCLPFRSEAFTAVALMHVLEHVREPHLVFREIQRLLVPGGRLFVDVPFMYQLHHQPNDYFRYTPHSLQHMAEAVGLEVEEILPSGGYFRFIAYAMRRAPSAVATSGMYASLVRVFVGWPLAAIGTLLDRIQYFVDICDSRQELVCGYHAILRKPANG